MSASSLLAGATRVRFARVKPVIVQSLLAQGYRGCMQHRYEKTVVVDAGINVLLLSGEKTRLCSV